MTVSKETKIDRKYSRTFLIVLLLGILYLCVLILRPFWKEILISAVLVTIFYPVYLKLGFWLRGRMTVAAVLTCLFILLLIVIPLSYFFYLLTLESVDAYNRITGMFNDGFLDTLANSKLWHDLPGLVQGFDLSGFVLGLAGDVKDVLLKVATGAVRSTTQIIFSLLVILITMFFMFKDGAAFLRRLMYLTPLENKYDKLIWLKFRSVSYSVIVSTFVTAIAQGVVGAVGLLIVGVPAFFAGVAMAVFALLPYAGAAFVWLPIAIYLLITGSIWQGIFLLIWGVVLVSFVDNVLRPYLIKDKAGVHPLIIFFSIVGGLLLMGFWGIIFGPLVLALAVTVLHIYELEYSNILR